MICPQCHSENKDDAKFCNECGASLKDAFGPAVADDDGQTGAEEAPEQQPADDATAFEQGRSDALKLPSIEVEGVNVDEDGNAFDFEDIDDGGDMADGEDAVDDAPSDDGPQPADPSKTAKVAPVGRGGADLSGLDECLVDAGYVPPRASWRSGDTMEMPRIEGEPAPRQKEFRAPDPNAGKRGKGKAVATVLIVLALVAAGAAAVTYYLELWGGKTLPDVVGYTQSDAAYALESRGFGVKAMPVKSDEAEGVVLLTDPAAGARQEPGTEVVIHVAVARSIPDVAGKQRDEAAKLFEEEGLQNVTVVEQKSDEAEGTVLSVSPEAGGKAKASTPVTVTVAVPFTVPDVTNMTWGDASAALEAEGYVARASYEYNEDVAPGTALRTDPAAGQKLASGSTVTVVVSMSRASELEAAALAYLQSAGTVSIGGTTYEIASVDAVKYLGNDQTSFTVTGSAVTTLDGETVRGSAKQKSGTITWNSANEIVGIA